MNQEYISLKSVVADTFVNPKMADMPFEMIVSNTLELMQITGCPLLFYDKEEVLKIEHHRAMLPCDYYEIRQLRLEKPCMKHTGSSPMRVYERTETTTIEDEDGEIAKTVTKQIGAQQVAVVHQHNIPVSPMFKEGTGTFEDANYHPGADLTYKIQDRFIITSIPHGFVRLAYRAIKVDDEGFPMIVNNASFIRALKSYYKKNWYCILLESGQLSDNANMAQFIYGNAEQEYYANIAQAQNSLLNITPEKMRNISNILTDMMPRQYEHATGYNDLNKEHSLKVHNSR